MHNNIMAAGSRDRLPMLKTGRYAQWRSCFLRYIDTTPNGDAFRKCILEDPYTPFTIIIPSIPAIDNALAVPEQTTVETILNISPENKAYFESEKEAIHLLLTRIGDKIYLTIDACKTGHEINNLTIAMMQVNVQFLQQLQPEWSRFVKIVKQQHKLDELSYHKLFDIMKQYQKEVNEIRAERIAKNANPLALVAAAQPYQDPYYQAPKSHKSYAPASKASLQPDLIPRHKGKEVAKPITPPSESASEEDSDPEQARKDKDMLKNLELITKYFKKLYKPTNNNLRTSLNSRNKNVDTTPRYKNDNKTGQFGNQRTVNVVREYKKPKRVKDSTYHKEKMLLCKQAKKGVQLQAEQSDWLADTNEEIDKQELEAHYSYMAKIQEVPTADSGTDSEPLEHIQKQLKKANTTLAHELTECKSILAETSKTLRESNSIRDSCLISLQNKLTEFKKYKTLNDCTVDYEKLEHKLNKTLGLLAQKDIDIKEGLKLKAYEILVVKEKHDDIVKQSLLTKSHYKGLVEEKTKVITDLKLKEEKDIDKMISMEKQLKFLNEIVYKRNQSIQTIHMLTPKGLTFNGRPTFANPMYLKKAQSKKPYLYAILNDQSDPVNRLVPDKEETLTLERESRSKLNKDLERMKNDIVCKEKVSNVFQKEREQYFEIQDLKAQLQDKNIAICELKKLIEKCKG
nr:hypothetical protein [Tanacetum cinerariifolium]